MMVSYLQAFYRYPSLLRKLAARISPEEVGDRLRETSTKGSIISLSCVPEFYLAGRQTLIELGLLKSDRCTRRSRLCRRLRGTG